MTGYLLTILSSGRPEYLARTLDALAEHLTPKPSEIFLYDDSAPRYTVPIYESVRDSGLADFGTVSRVGSSDARLGMCAAHAKCWQAAADSEFEWALHWEDDMVLLRPLDVEDLAETMDANRHLAQMALVRTPWGAEVEHGGYIPQTPGWYQRRVGEAIEAAFCNACDQQMSPDADGNWDCGEHGTVGYYWGASRPAEWIEQRRNWTCAPALIRTDLARAFPWPTEPGCETTIGPRIIDALPDAQFGLWGHGECWCAHVGVDRAEGSHGY